jgi:hypothetical protein
MKHLYKRHTGFNKKYGLSYLLLILLTIFLLYPLIFQNHVLLPHNNGVEMGLQRQSPQYLRFFNDIPAFFLPKLQLHFNVYHGPARGIWNPAIECGRPAGYGIYSQDSPIAWIARLVTADPIRLHTAIAVITLFLLVTFAFLLFKELGLHENACLLGAVGIGLGVRSAFWLGYSQFLFWVAGSLALLWLVGGYARTHSRYFLLGIIIMTYLTLMMGRPQAVIKSLYFLIPYSISIVWNREHDWKNFINKCFHIIMAAVVGALLSLPLYLDIWEKISRSTRADAGVKYLIKTAISESTSLARFCSAFIDLWDPWINCNLWRYNAIPKTFSTLSFSPLFWSFFFIGLFSLRLRKHVIELVVFVLFFLMSASEPVYLFGVKFLGFNFQRTNLLGGTIIPFFIFCTYAIDVIIRQKKLNMERIYMALGCVSGIFLFAAIMSQKSVPYLLNAIAILLFTLVLVGIFIKYSNMATVLVLSLFYVILYGFPFVLHRPYPQIHFDSPIITAISNATKGGYRFAKFKTSKFLPSDEEVLCGLSSIHAYDPLPAKQYVQWYDKIGGTRKSGYTKQFQYIKSRENILSEPFSYTGVNMIVSEKPLELTGWTVEKINHLYLYKAIIPPALYKRTVDFKKSGNEVKISGDLSDIKGIPFQLIHKMPNRYTFLCDPIPTESLLFLSVQFNKGWQIDNPNPSHGLKTVRINNFYLGVLIPPGTTNVVLVFKDNTRLILLTQVIVLILLLISLTGPAIRAGAGFKVARPEDEISG